MQLAQTLASTPFTANSDNLVDALMGRLYPVMLLAHRCVVRKQVKLRADIDAWFSWFEQRPEWEMLAMPNKTLAWDAARSCVALATFSDARQSDDDHFFPVRGFAAKGTRSSDVILNIQIFSKSEDAAHVTAELTRAFGHPGSTIQWYYTADGESVSVPLREDRRPMDAMYPFLGRPLAQFWDEYTASSASILVLIGPPGTGKTSFIRGFLQHAQHSAIVTYDPEVLKRDFVFSRFVSGSEDVLVLEDADDFLRARDKGLGNDMMHRFLSVGDGLVTTSGKKMIFSTNLENVNDIDPALLRKGRCFDVLRFRALTQDEAAHLAALAGLPVPQGQLSYTAADVLAPETRGSLDGAAARTRVGF